MESCVGKRTLTFFRIGFFLVILFIIAVPHNFALAQGGGADAGQASNPFVNTGNNPGNTNAAGYYSGIGNYSPSNPTGAETVTGTADPTQQTTQERGANTESDKRNAANAMQIEQTYGVLISIGGWIAGLGGNAFEIAFTNFALKLGCYFTTGNGNNCSGALVTGGAVGGVVNELWMLIRDLFNVALIFSLIFLGFKIILGSDDTGTRKALGMLLVAALMVNFSLYIAKLVVDLSNFTTTQIYSTMTQAGGSNFGIGDGTKPGDFELSTKNGNNLAGAFMTVLKVPSLFNSNAGNSLAFAILAMFFLVFLGAILLYGAIMLVARFIAIVILLILSPIMFLGWVLPNFKPMSKTWQKNFISYCFYAPVYIFFLYMSLYTLLQMAPAGEYGAAFADSGKDAADAMSVFVFFIVGAGMLFASAKVASSLAKSGAGSTMTMADGWARKFGMGAVGLMATVPTGLAGNGITNLSDAYERKTGRSNPLSRGANYTGTKLKDQKVFGVSATQKVNATNKWFKDSKETGDKRARGLRDDAAKEKKQNDAIEILNDENKSAEHEQTIAGLSPNAVVAMAKDTHGAAGLLARAQYLRSDQIKALEDDKELNKVTIDNIKKARKESLTGEFKPETISKADIDKLQLFDLKTLTLPEYAINLSEAKIDKLPSPKFTETDKQTIKEKRTNAIKDIFDGKKVGDWTTTSFIEANKPADIAKFPTAVVESTNFIDAIYDADKLNADMLGHIARESSADKRKVGKIVLDKYGAFTDLDKAPADIIGFFKSGPGVAFHPQGFKIPNRDNVAKNNQNKSSTPVSEFTQTSGGLYMPNK